MKAFEIIAENKIREAIENGEFDNLPGFGKPLDFGELERVPAEFRMVYSILKNSGYSQPETDIVKQIHALKEEARKETNGLKQAGLAKLIERKEAELQALRNRQLPKP